MSPACTWHKCCKQRAHWLGLPLCIYHAEYVAQQVAKGEADKAEARQQAKDDVVAKINEGIQLEDDEPVPGWIYYIRIGDTIKIGYSKDVNRRMRAYPPTAELLAVEPGTTVLERKRHQHFGAHLAHGREWFTPNPELDTWITTLRDHYGDPSGKAHTYTRPTDTPPQIIGMRHGSFPKKRAAA